MLLFFFFFLNARGPPSSSRHPVTRSFIVFWVFFWSQLKMLRLTHRTILTLIKKEGESHFFLKWDLILQSLNSTVRESALKVDFEKKNPLPLREIEPVLATCRSNVVQTELHPHSSFGGGLGGGELNDSGGSVLTSGCERGSFL